MLSKRSLCVALSLGAFFAAGCDGCRKDGPNTSTRLDAGPMPSVTIAITPPGASMGPLIPGSLTKFFPKDGDGGYKRVIAGEHEGYAEAKLSKDGKELAILTITDADRLAYAKARFEGATEKLGDFPVITTGDTQTSVLVRGRFQVKVQSATLDHEARKAILAKFDLAAM